jgi:hypothetical protein
VSTLTRGRFQAHRSVGSPANSPTPPRKMTQGPEAPDGGGAERTVPPRLPARRHNAPRQARRRAPRATPLAFLSPRACRAGARKTPEPRPREALASASNSPSLSRLSLRRHAASPTLLHSISLSRMASLSISGSLSEGAGRRASALSAAWQTREHHEAP